MSDLGLVMLSGEFLLELLTRAHAGEDPDLLILETWGSSEHVEGDDDV